MEYQQLPTDNGLAKFRINWKPNTEGHAGTHFFTEYRIKGENECIKTSEEKNRDFQEIAGLAPNEVYEFRVVAVDGHFMTESSTEEVDIIDIDGPIKVPNQNVANAGWFIGMMLALAIIICIIHRNRGGKYDVHDRELKYKLKN